MAGSHLFIKEKFDEIEIEIFEKPPEQAIDEN